MRDDFLLAKIVLAEIKEKISGTPLTLILRTALDDDEEGNVYVENGRLCFWLDGTEYRVPYNLGEINRVFTYQRFFINSFLRLEMSDGSSSLTISDRDCEIEVIFETSDSIYRNKEAAKAMEAACDDNEIWELIGFDSPLQFCEKIEELKKKTGIDYLLVLDGEAPDISFDKSQNLLFRGIPTGYKMSDIVCAKYVSKNAELDDMLEEMAEINIHFYDHTCLCFEDRTLSSEVKYTGIKNSRDINVVGYDVMVYFKKRLFDPAVKFFPKLNVPDEEASYEVVQFGCYNGCPIQWLVLTETEDQQVLLAKDTWPMPVHRVPVPVKWGHTSLWEWLNGEFYEKSFSDFEKERIIKTTTKNSQNPLYKFGSDEELVGKVTLLSIQEVESLVPMRHRNLGKRWWLRSPGKSDFFQSYVTGEGQIDPFGIGKTASDFYVRPVIVIKKIK